jgi:hypothetical protein
MERNRINEQGRIPFRNGRFCYIAGQWFFSRRGGAMDGPYPDHEKAEQACQRYLAHLREPD